jgi:hypothetical protein
MNPDIRFIEVASHERSVRIITETREKRDWMVKPG